MKSIRRSFLICARIMIPLLMGIAILAILTNIVYSGSKRESLASFVESQLIERAIRFAERPAMNPGRVVTITLTEAEINNFPSAPRELLRDASIDTYAEVLKIALSSNPKLVIVNWLNGAHHDSIQYLQPVLDVIDRFNASEKVFLTFPISYFSVAPPELLDRYPVMEGMDCVYEVNNYCSIFDWDTWTVSQLAKRLWIDRRPYSVSYNLPHVLPNIILNLPEQESIPDFSFSAVLKGDKREQLNNAEVISIGNDVLQDVIFENNKDEIQKTYIATSNPRSSLMRDGLPFHKFWAGMAQMFLDNATVSVTPKIITQFLTAVVVLIIIIILIKAGSAYALAVFVCTCISYFFFNNFSMRYFGFYLPIFDVLYTAFLATLLSAFLGISYNLYRQSVLTAEQEGMAENIDLKSNFLSLVTHNLNTPIAKLKGLFDVITMQGFYNRFRNQVDLCRQKVALMQIAVKSVLLSTALEQNNLYAKNHTLAQLSEEFIDLAKPIYEPFGLEVNVEYAVEDLSPVQIDPKFFIHAILVLILTHAKSQQNIRVYLSVGEGGVNGSIAMKNLNGISPLSSFVKEMSQKYLNDFKSITGIKVTENLFMDQVQIQLFVP